MIWTNETENLIDLTEYELNHFDENENGENALKIFNAESTIRMALNNEFRTKLEKKALKIVQSNIDFFIGHKAVIIDVEGYKCVAKITNEWRPIEICSAVFPFDEEKTYPRQDIEKKYVFKRY